jgi:hypothetical protein
MPCSEHRGWIDDVRGRVGVRARLDGSARHRLTLFCPGAGVQELPGWRWQGSCFPSPSIIHLAPLGA